jgi:putative endopeptidase
MNRVLAVVLTTTVLAGCAATPPPAPPPPPAVAEAVPPAPPPPPAPKPQYGTFGFDTAGMDSSVAPGDDFYDFANGTWAKNTPIPADKSNYGMFTVLDDLSRQRTKEIIEGQAQDPNSKIGNAYASFMDEAALEAKGLGPFDPWLNQVRGLKSK